MFITVLFFACIFLFSQKHVVAETPLGMINFAEYPPPPYPPRTEKNLWVFWNDLNKIPLIQQMFMSSMLVSKGDSFTMYFITESNALSLLEGTINAPYFQDRPGKHVTMIELWKTYVLHLDHAATRKDFVCGVLLAAWGGALLDPGLMVEDPDLTQTRLEKWWETMEQKNIQYFNFAYGGSLKAHNKINIDSGGNGKFYDKYQNEKWQGTAWIDVYFMMTRQSSSIMQQYLDKIIDTNYHPEKGKEKQTYFMYGSDALDNLVHVRTLRLCGGIGVKFQKAPGSYFFESPTGLDKQTGAPDNVLLLDVYDDHNRIDPVNIVPAESLAVPMAESGMDGQYKWLSGKPKSYSPRQGSCMAMIRYLWNRKEDEAHTEMVRDLIEARDTASPGGGFFYYKFFNSAGDLKMREGTVEQQRETLCATPKTWVVQWIETVAPSSNPCVESTNDEYRPHLEGTSRQHLRPAMAALTLLAPSSPTSVLDHPTDEFH